MPIEKNHGLIFALSLAAVLLAATLLAYRTPAPLAADVSPSIFSATRARDILKELVGDDVPHPLGSPADAKVRDLIVKRLTELGYATELQTGVICNDFAVCGKPTNIIAKHADLAGQEVVLLAAHYDSVPAGPGASDDGAGVANLLEIARVLTQHAPPKHPIALLITDGEEAGLLGAQLFTREHALAKQVRAAVNMEARGVSGPSLMFETGNANAWLMRLYAASTAEPITNSLNYVVYKTLPNNTDFTVFKAAAYQGFNFAFIGDVAHYHTPLDNWANSSATTMQHQGENALSSLLALANSPDLHPPVQDSVFFDVFARGVVVWPTGLVLPAAVISLLLLLAEAALLNRKGLLSVRQMGAGTLSALLNVLLGAALSVGTLALLRFLGRLPPLDALPWIAHPMAMHIVFASLALLCACAVAAWFTRRAGFWGFWFGAALLVALLSVATAALIPGASFILLLAAMASGIAALPCLIILLRGGSAAQRWCDLAALLPGLVMFVALLPLLLMLYSALGAPAWPISTIALCLITAFLVPLLANATRRARQGLTLIAALVIFAGISMTLLLPTYSNLWPQRINVEYWIDADSGHAHWWTQTASMRLPRAMAKIVKFDPEPRTRFVGYPRKGFYADAPALKLTAPELTQVSVSPGALPGRNHYELRLRSSRDAPTAFVVFPAGAYVEEVVVMTPWGPLHAKLNKFHDGATAFSVAGMAADGLQFGIDASSTASPVLVFDQSFGLPEEISAGKALQRARPQNATSSQDGDITVVQRTVRLDPAAGR
jgi:hypothetical protein